MGTETVMRICDVHGLTEYYVSKGIANKCIICAKKKAIEWRNSSEENMRKHLKGVKQWVVQNPDIKKEYVKKASENYHKKRTEVLDSFYCRFGNLISETSSKLLIKKIPKSIKRMKEPTDDKIIKYLIDHKRQEIFSYEKFRISSYVKWRILGAHNLISATEEQKLQIRKEYTEEASKIADLEIKKLLKNLK